MNPVLASRVAHLSDLGWAVTGQTETTASLETRTPFGWLWFALWFLVFLGIGAIMYTIWWLTTSQKQVFLSLTGGDSVSINGDSYYVAQQEAEIGAIIRTRQAVEEKGFLKAAWPSIASSILVLIAWFFIIWLVVKLID